MLKPLKTLLAYIQKPGVPSQEIETALDDAREAVAAAEQDVAKAEQADQAGLLDSTDVALQKAIEQRQAAIEQRDRAKALVEALKTKLAAVRTNKAHSRKLNVYGPTRTKRDAAAERFQVEYLKHATAIAAIIRDCAEADTAVAQANSDPPADHDPLLTVETLNRSHRAQPHKIIKDKVVSLWAYGRTSHVLNPEMQHQVRSTCSDKGALYTEDARLLAEVDQRKYRRLEFLRETTSPGPRRRGIRRSTGIVMLSCGSLQGRQGICERNGPCLPVSWTPTKPCKMRNRHAS